ncbi:MAG TPA: pentapeptide repeat-containing protein [Thermoanaerobaculia bacterium]|jgi:hypothetical protein
MNELSTRLGLSQQDQRSLAKTVGRVKTINEFFADAVDGLKGIDFVEAAQKASPWLAAIGSSVADVVPAVKFVVKLFEKLTAIDDPASLGLLAYTVAYEQAVLQAVRAVGRPAGAAGETKVLSEKLRSVADAMPEEILDFTRVSFGSLLAHPFITHADLILEDSAGAVGYTERQRRELTNEVHQRFTVHLKTLLSHRDTAAKFEPFTRFLELRGGDAPAVVALMEHAQYHRALFQERPVFGKEVFALSHVYVDTECGKLPWGQIREGGEDGERADPFDERWGGRHRLGRTVLELIADPKFRDAIVIQGVAGAGKSAFTQWLAAELVRQGLRPIRILLRDVRLERTRPVAEALAEALRYGDEAERGTFSYPRPDDPFLGGSIFKERVGFGNASICPYVLILDGWDEISISVAEGFKLRLNRMLEQLRGEFLTNRDVPVRVILTGRPSADVADSAFLLKTTPILTLRPFNPKDLELFLTRLTGAVNGRPLPVEGTGWPRVEMERFEPALKQYNEDFEASKEGQSVEQAEGGGPLGILGLPLLAFLAARLLSHAEPRDAEKVIESPTTLYRNLVDLTCAGGKFVGAGEETEQSIALKGHELRDLLRRTASAMTVYGKENIPYDELEMRLDLGERALDRAVDDATRDNALSQLMVSYYFKGGHTDLGCEFLHKSFREYLFAEGVVELLKAWAQTHGTRKLAEREPYWKDFEPTDPRHGLSRDLGSMLGAQWLRPEVVGHLSDLLTWEIQRSVHGEQSPIAGAQPTAALSVDQWAAVRDALADVWDWWGEGVHLRPQPVFDHRQRLDFLPPLAHEMVMRTMPLALGPRQVPQPPRVTTVDGHLGDALFRLNQILHFRIAEATGWLGTKEQPVAAEDLWGERKDARRYQVEVERGGTSWVLFSPGGTLSRYLTAYTARINATGWRPRGMFPSKTDLRALHLDDAELLGYIHDTDFSYCSLRNCIFIGYGLGSRYQRAHIADSNFIACYMAAVAFENAHFKRVHFASVEGAGASFRNTSGMLLTFKACDVTAADFGGANIDGLEFIDTPVTRAHFDPGARERYGIAIKDKP